MIEVLPVEKMQAMAATAPKPEPSKNNGNGHGHPFTSRLDIPRWLADRGVSFKSKDRRDSKGRTVYLLDCCPFDSGHGGGGEVSIMQSPDGTLSARCMHSSCTGRGWQEFKAVIGKPDLDHYDPPLTRNGSKTRPAVRTPIPAGTIVYALDRGNYGDVVDATGDPVSVHFESEDHQHATVDIPRNKLRRQDGGPLDGEADGPPRFITSLVSSKKLVDEPAEVSYIVQNMVTAGEPGTGGGPAKCLKTLTTTDLALSVASGQPFLGHFHVMQQGPVGFLSGESGRAVLRRAALRIAKAKGVDLRELPITWGFSLPQLTALDHVAALGDWIAAEKLLLLVLDPTYLCLLNTANAGMAGNLFAMGAALAPLSEIVGRTGTTILLLHHYRKNRPDNGGEPADLQDLAMSGMMEWSRFWLLLDRIEPYANDGIHRLWLRAGGSAGHAGLYGLTVNERAGDQRDGWDVQVEHVGDMKRSIKDAKEQWRVKDMERNEAEHVQRVVEALKKFPNGETERTIKAAARLNSDNLTRAILTLEKAGRIERCTIKKGRQEDAWRLVQR
jgi:hypothetical protein